MRIGDKKIGLLSLDAKGLYLEFEIENRYLTLKCTIGSDMLFARWGSAMVLFHAPRWAMLPGRK